MSVYTKGATLKNAGTTLVGTIFNNPGRVTNPETGKSGYFVELQVAQFEGANPSHPRQQNGFLYDEAQRNDDGSYVKGENGQTYRNRSQFYPEEVINRMVEAANASGNIAERKDKQGNVVGNTYVFNATIMESVKRDPETGKSVKDANGKDVPDVRGQDKHAPWRLAVSKDPSKDPQSIMAIPEGLVVPDNVIDAQAKAMKQNRDDAKARKAEKEAAKNQPTTAKDAADAAAKKTFDEFVTQGGSPNDPTLLGKLQAAAQAAEAAFNQPSALDAYNAGQAEQTQPSALDQYQAAQAGVPAPGAPSAPAQGAPGAPAAAAPSAPAQGAPGAPAGGSTNTLDAALKAAQAGAVGAPSAPASGEREVGA